MKTPVQIYLVIVLVFALVIGTLQVSGGGSTDVGWNSRAGANGSIAYQIVLPPGDTPNVGWNS